MRLEKPLRENLPPDAQAVYDRIAAYRGTVRGPFNVLMYRPTIADGVAGLGERFRGEALLSDADRELAILATVREAGAAYAWSAHEPPALRAGVQPETVAIVRDRQPSAGLTLHERVVIDVARNLLREHRLDGGLYDRAIAEFGQESLVELVALIGFYSMIGVVLNAFEVEVPEGQTPAFID